MRPTIFVAPLFDRYSGYGSKVDRMQGVRGKYAVHGFDSGVFFDGLFLTVFSEVLTVSSRISSFPQILGLSESRRQSPGWYSLDGNLPIWAVRGFPLVVRLAHPGWSPSQNVSGSSSPSQARQVQLGSAAPPGQPFSLDNVVYASCSLSSSGALGRLPWATQNLFWVTLNKEFSFREEVRSWSRSC